MANLKKFEASKKDMNFFSTFSGSAGQMGSYLSLVLIVFLVFLVVGGAVFAFVFLQTNAAKSNIKSLTAQMQSQEYIDQLADYSELSNGMSGLNQQYYNVSSLFSFADNAERIDSVDMDSIYSNLPADIVITSFDYSEGTITLAGGASSYYSPLDMIANFTKAKIFTYVSITEISQADLSTSDLSPEDLVLANKYNFTIQGFLKEFYPLVISKLVDDASLTPLTAVKSQTVGVGEDYTETGINTFTADDGSIYTLSRISIDNVPVAEADLAVIRQNDSLSGTVAQSTDIKLFYTLTSGGTQG